MAATAPSTAHDTPTIEAQIRTKLGTNECRRLRKAGKLPAVVYGHQQDPVHISFDAKTINDLLHSHVRVLDVRTDDGKSEHCLVKELQWNHLGNKIVHLDMTRIDINERVTVEVELTFVGDAVGLKTAGAFMEHPATSLEIECLASQIPDAIKVDVSGMNVDEAISAAEVTLPEGMTLVSDGELVVASIAIAVAEPEPEEEGDGSEPEVIGGKKDEDGASE